MFSELNINDNINTEDLNNAFRKLYITDYFKDIKINFSNGNLNIDVLENPLIQSIKINGVKNKTILEEISKITKKLEDTKVEQINLTEAGYKDYLKQLKDYKSERPQLADEVRRAAADGDIRENAPLDAAREKIEMVNSKIFEIEAILKVANIIDNTSGGDRIVIGSKVSVKNHQNQNNYDYQLVEANEANPLLGKISSVSPVGSAILGRRIGDEVTVSTPGGEQIYTIDSIN